MSAQDMMGLAAGPPPGAPPSIMVGGDQPPGGGGAPGMPPGLPPDMAALLGGGGEGPDAGGDFPQDEVESLEDIRERMMNYMDIASDDIEKSEMAKLLAGVQKLLAKNQQEHEAASGVTPAHKGMRKAIQAGAP